MSTDINPNKSHGLFIQVADTNLNFRQVSVADSSLTGTQILASCDVTPRQEFVVLQLLNGDTEEVRPDEIVNVQKAPVSRFIVARADRLYRLVLNDHSIAWPDKCISEIALRTLGKVPPADAIYVMRENKADRLLSPGEILSLADVGVETLYSKPPLWELNVQGVLLTFDHPNVIVRDALTKAGFDPEQGWIIVLKTRDEKKQVSLADTIDLRSPGIEKLRLTPREINNGENIAIRREFRLLQIDEDGLTARGIRWETLIVAGRRWLILRAFELPAGYNVPRVDIAVEIPVGYPTAEIDMFYCFPHLARNDGHQIPQTQATETIEDKNYQRWSRHRGAIAPWRPGHDNAITHLALIEAAIIREVEQ